MLTLKDNQLRHYSDVCKKVDTVKYRYANQRRIVSYNAFSRDNCKRQMTEAIILSN